MSETYGGRPVTREFLEKRRLELQAGMESIASKIAGLQQQVEQLQRDGIATNGALQEVEYWLVKIGAPIESTVNAGVALPFPAELME